MGHEATSQKIFCFTKEVNKIATVKCKLQCHDNLVMFLSKPVSGTTSPGKKVEIFHNTLDGDGWCIFGGHLIMSKTGLVALDPSAVVGMKGKIAFLNHCIYLKHLATILTLQHQPQLTNSTVMLCR